MAETVPELMNRIGEIVEGCLSVDDSALLADDVLVAL